MSQDIHQVVGYRNRSRHFLKILTIAERSDVYYIDKHR
jgi:hypothetical protein